MRTMPIVVIAAAALLLAGCSDDETSTGPHETATHQTTMSTPSADFNDTDITFLEGMYPHHAQAIEMAALVETRSEDPQVQQLAIAIEQAQGPEMATITSLLESFGRPAPSTMETDHAGHGGGMMSAEQMQDLEAATGTEFDRMFLTMMIEHHRGAIEMANAEIAAGTNADAKQLAETIVAAQQAEIDQMNAMLN